MNKMNKNTFKLFNNKKISLFLFIALLSACTFTGCGKKEIEEKSDNYTEQVYDVETGSETLSVPDIIIENNISASENPTEFENASESENISDLNYIDNDLENSTVSDASISYSPVFSSPYIFYDVFRNEYEMDLNGSVLLNPYNPDCYSYYDTDASGNKMAESSDPYACNTKPESTPDIQMQGYSGIIKYDDDIYTSRFGIDVSKFQGNIDWNKVKSAGVDFAFVRVGFRGYGQAGDLKEDSYYRKNIEGAQAAGLDVGVYFYAQAVNEEEACEEADFVLNLINGYNLELPIVYDPEHVLNDTARTDDVTGEQFTKNARAFSDRILSSGNTPMIYANMMWEAFELDLSMLSDVEIWFADYENKPQSPYYFTVWQYSQNGKVSGIDGPVDLNIMYVPK